MPKYSYEVSPRAKELGGGWQLRLLEDGEEAGGGVFPADPDADPLAGMAWWNAMKEETRRWWMGVAGNTGRVVDAYGAFLSQEAHADAMSEGDEWLSTRGEA